MINMVDDQMGFTKLSLNQKLLDAIKELGFSKPTQIQERTIPLILQGRDVVGHSQTGSGKTAAFGLPLLEKIVQGQGVQVLILTPTRELAVQVKEDIDKMSKYSGIKSVAIYGGVGFGYQTEGVKISEIIIATPGRLIDHLERRTVSLNKIKFVVLDEADRMLDMGFEKSVNRILGQVPKQKQMIMFSATIPIEAQRMIKKYMNNPAYAEAEKQIHADLLKHTVYRIERENKFSLLVHLLKHSNGTAIVFCRTKRETDKVAKNLKKQDIHARPVHGDLTQNKRQFAVNEFKEGKISTLVATDVAARGLHIHGVSHVYNYDVPDNADDYTHRIGRTARAGMKGEAITILCPKDEELFRGIIKSGKKIEEKPLPEFEKVILVKDAFNLPRAEKRKQFKGQWEQNFKEKRNNGRSFFKNQDNSQKTGEKSGENTSENRFGRNTTDNGFHQKSRPRQWRPRFRSKDSHNRNESRDENENSENKGFKFNKFKKRKTSYGDNQKTSSGQKFSNNKRFSNKFKKKNFNRKF
jgi:ATP-dependent RNA helicase DeaD